jgi:predicted nucleic acid-binding protein
VYSVRKMSSVERGGKRSLMKSSGIFRFIRSHRDRLTRRPIEGERAARGTTIAFEDLLIAATALHLGFALATSNIRHFQVIPGLRILPL